MIYRDRVKRVLDVVAALALISILSIPMLLLALTIACCMGRPVLFHQKRVGLNEEIFYLYKFRSMRNVYDLEGNLLPDAERLTAFGRLLRASSLDELPELWNVVRGDMSLVGPRPLLPDYLPYYSQHQSRRHEVRPGLTGLAQIRGRNAATWDDRLNADVEYVDRLSFSVDLSILVATLGTLVSRKGISAEGHATMPRFDDEVRARRMADKD